ncbi:MAG: PEGA domain-containing protein [Spirochaetes bacterium]|nr:PEGA domain-containing protein [Spirochaetota bacterium]
MKSPALFVLIFASLTLSLFARGRAEEEPPVVTINNQWTLTITSFDTESLPARSQFTPILISRSLVNRLSLINYRVRLSPEYNHHEEAAWAAMRQTAAAALAASQHQRSLLVFQGEPGWRHRQNLARLDAQIETQWEALEEVENNRPVANRQPEFSLSGDNLNWVFPPPPEAGDEFRFTQRQNIDAFLTGRIWEFHGRYVVSFRLFTGYARAFVYEDEIIFSPEELEDAMDEMTNRLIIALSGSDLGAVAVVAQPPDALVLINRSFAGIGTVEPAEFPFGEITVEISAEGYVSETIEIEITAGDLVTIQAELAPIEYTEVHIFSEPGASVFAGALFVGQAPLTLRLPLNQFEYISVISEQPDGGIARAVILSPDSPHESIALTMSLLPDRRGEGRVMNARRMHYHFWGLAWLAGIATWVAYGNLVNATQSINFAQATGRSVSPDIIDNRNTALMQRNYFGAALIGLLAVNFVFVGRYLFIANQETPRNAINR